MTRKPARSSTCAACCLAYAKCVIVGLSIIIIVCIVGAIKGPSAVNKIVADKIKTVVDEMMVLSPSTQLFQNWVDPKVPVYQKFYFFDLQNPDDVLNSGAKPRYVEKGPYSYRLHVSRYDVEFGDNDTLSYRQLNWLEFAPEVSAGLENDSITTINVPFVGLASGAKHQDWFSRLTVSALAKIHEHEMFTRLTIGEILWGYEDPLLKQLQLMVGEEKVPTYKIGLLLRTNGSRFSTVVNTGASNSTMLNKIVTFNDKTAFKLWATKEANMINGSDGSMFHPGVTAEESFYVFNPMRCRSVPYIYKESQLHYDIPMMKFHIPWYTYANASSYPPNAGFCLQDSCPDGILNVTACTKGPIGMSLPHFLYASPDIIESFDGIEPNETKHQSYLTVEPITGVSYIQRRRLQMNVYMETVDSIMQTEGVRSMYYPYCWIEMSADVPESIATYFRSNMSIVDGLDVITRYVFIGLAGLCLLIIILMLLCMVTKW
ncbi:lysosome membrane protein 2-like [Amphiura filiformis]|uniref:lysosome membrane protein 2-like n=1 Tax=Amphiura filiformis TaxID=82378 RepID=UPI003B217FC5